MGVGVYGKNPHKRAVVSFLAHTQDTEKYFMYFVVGETGQPKTQQIFFQSGGSANVQK